MSTPHNSANKGDIAKTVLMPGDPLRAKYIANTFLTEVVQFNDVRGMYGFTGKYKGKDISIMGSGMGMPSIGIYSFELYTEYEVDTIIRIGSAGSYTNDIKVYDVVLASMAWSESSYALTQNGYSSNTIMPTQKINDKIVNLAKELAIPLIIAPVHSSDVFYRDDKAMHFSDIYKEHGCVCVEMESFALFHNANILGKNAACLLTISDSMITHEETTPAEREKSFTQMMELALAYIR